MNRQSTYTGIMTAICFVVCVVLGIGSLAAADTSPADLTYNQLTSPIGYASSPVFQLAKGSVKSAGTNSQHPDGLKGTNARHPDSWKDPFFESEDMYEGPTFAPVDSLENPTFAPVDSGR